MMNENGLREAVDAIGDAAALLKSKGNILPYKAIVVDEAQDMNDSVRTGHLQDEYDTLVDYLTKSIGLGGKQRKVYDHSDKARSAVTWRIRSAIKKINEAHDALGEHLGKSIKTGSFCSYVPQSNMNWIL